MKKRYSLVCRGHRGGTFYCYDSETRKRESLGTKDADEAQRLIDARNDSLRQPALNFNIARAYLAGADPLFGVRTWQHVMNSAIECNQGKTRVRWQSAVKNKTFDLIRNRKISETPAELFFQVIQAGKVSTHLWLRRLHCFALDMGWLAWPILPKKKWPPLRYGARRAITAEEHQKILEHVRVPEHRAFYELLWHNTGAAV